MHKFCGCVVGGGRWYTLSGSLPAVEMTGALSGRQKYLRYGIAQTEKETRHFDEARGEIPKM